MSVRYNIRLNKEIMFKDEDKKIVNKRIALQVPEQIKNILEEVKGDEPWISLLIDGAKYRGVEIDFVPNFKYKTHHYCSFCGKWIPHEKGVYGVARARVRCPKCFGTLRTRSR